MAFRLKETGFAQKIIGVDNNPANLETAIQLGWIDEVMPLSAAMAQSQLVIIAIRSEERRVGKEC